MRVDAVLFDLDDTLVDRSSIFQRWCVRMTDELRITDPRAVAAIVEMDDHGRTSREDLFAQITERWAVPVTSEALLQHYQSEFPRTFTVADDVVNALRTLRSSHVAVGVVTNGPPTQRTKLEVSGLIDEVDVVCVSGEVGAHKPDRAIFDLALKSLGSPSAAWMVGDSPEADVAGAHAAGIPAAWVSRGRNWPAAQRPPEMTVGSVVEFADWALGAAD